MATGVTLDEEARAGTTTTPVSRPRKRKAGLAQPQPSTNGDTVEENVQPPPAKRQRKKNASSSPRKASLLKQKRKAPPDSSKPKRTRKTNRQDDPSSSSPPPPMATPVTEMVAKKIQQVKMFISKGARTALEWHADDRNTIVVPQSLLTGAIMNMRVHYEIGRQEDASIADVEEAVVKRFEGPIGTDAYLTQWFVVDVSKPTAFETGIKEKIAQHGLEGISLLETELEMLRKTQLERAGLRKEDPMAGGSGRLLAVVEEMSRLSGGGAGDGKVELKLGEVPWAPSKKPAVDLRNYTYASSETATEGVGSAAAIEEEVEVKIEETDRKIGGQEEGG